MPDTVWDHLRRTLGAWPADARQEPAGGRVGAALVLLGEVDGDLEIVYTRRHDDLRHHPGQISFPGGRVDAGETIEAAAVREAVEEVGLDPGSVALLGRLPAFFIPPSRFWLQAVLARWVAPHPLVPAAGEVAEVLRVRVSALRDPATWRGVRLSQTGASWAWQLDERHLLWGATALVTVMVLELLDTDWHRGTTAGALLAEREVRPWERGDAVVPLPQPARLRGVPEVGVDALAYVEDDPLAAVAPDDAAAAVVDAVARLRAARGGGDVLVLAGPGRTGDVGRRVAELLGAGATLVTTDDGAERRPSPAAAGGPAAVLPPADVVVDALLGAGLQGPLRGGVLELVHAVRTHRGAVLSVDVPTGLHARDGLVGEAVAADVTIAIGRPQPGLFKPGLAPFVGDLYVATPAGLLRVVSSGSSREAGAGERGGSRWRE